MLGDRVWQRDLCMQVELAYPHERMQQFCRAVRGLVPCKSGCCCALDRVSPSRSSWCCSVTMTEATGAGLEPCSNLSLLGWDTFLQTAPANEDRADVCLTFRLWPEVI